jgi:phenylalanyl-tRNA synthetase beta chain
VLKVTPPSWRFDLQIEEDLIEEVIRVLGYDKLPGTPPLAPVTAKVRSESQRSTHALRHMMAGLDYFETINFSFVEERWERELAGNAEPIRVLNPIASPLSVMRSGLVGGLVNVLRYNLARKATRVRLFEIGRVFKRNPSAVDGELSVAGLDQPARLGALAYGSAEPSQWGSKERAVDFFDLKGDVEALFAPKAVNFAPTTHPALHPGRSASIHVDGQVVGVIGELHPRWRQAYELPCAPIVFELELPALLAREVPQFAAIPRHQSAWRDIAVVVKDSVTHESLVSAIRATPTPLVRSAFLYDIYKPQSPGADIGAGERSMTVRLELLDDDNTLTDERMDAVVAQVLDSLGSRLGARLRG